MKSNLFLFLILLSMLSLFTACKKQTTKQKLLSEIENFQIDTIKAKPVDTANMNRADSCRYRADDVLRHYPEMYHATDNVTRAYRLWMELERDFIEKVFVGKDHKAKTLFERNNEKLDHRLEKLNFIEPLTAVIIDGAETSSFADTKLTTTPDEKAITDCYRKIMFRIKSGINSSKNDYSSDEMRTACERARRAWTEYIKSIDELLNTMPAECQVPMQQAIHNIICLHAIDLHNCYVQYWHDGTPGFILKDDCTPEAFASSAFEALNLCESMEKK